MHKKEFIREMGRQRGLVLRELKPEFRSWHLHTIEKIKDIRGVKVWRDKIDLVDRYMKEQVSDYDILRCIIDDNLEPRLVAFSQWVEHYNNNPRSDEEDENAESDRDT